MSELASSSSDSTLGSSDIALYETEFDELKINLSELAVEEFNGQSLFAAGSSTLAVVTSESGAQTTGITKMDFAAFTLTISSVIIDETTPANNTGDQLTTPAHNTGVQLTTHAQNTGVQLTKPA